MKKETKADIVITCVWFITILLSVIYLKNYDIPTVPTTVLSTLAATGSSSLARVFFYKRILR